MGERIESGVADAAQELAEGRMTGSVRADGDRVDEDTENVLGPGKEPVLYRRPDDNLLLAAIPQEQGRKCGDDDRVRCRLLGRRRPADERREVAVEGEDIEAPLEGLERGPGAIGGQFEERRRSGEPLLPERDLLRGDGPVQPLPLEDREVGILDPERRERRGPPGLEGLVESGHLLVEDLDRSSVGGDVMGDGDEHVVISGEADKVRAEKRKLREIEGTVGLADGDRPRLGLAAIRGKRREVALVERDRGIVMDDLDGIPAARGERRPENLVAARQLGENALEEFGLEGAPDANGGGDVVGRAAAVEVVEEPEPLLRGRERHLGLARRLRHRWSIAGIA